MITDSSLDESWETYSSAENEPSTTRPNEAPVDTWCMCFNCSQTPVKWECLYCQIKHFFIRNLVAKTLGLNLGKKLSNLLSNCEALN